MRIIEDLLGGSANLTLGTGWTATRIFFADGVVDAGPDAVQYEAIRNGQIPQPGERHPTIPLIIVESIRATGVDKTKVKMTINYKAPSFSNSTSGDEKIHIRISGTVQSVLTDKHFVNGKEEEIILKYKYPGLTDPKGVEGKVREVLARIEKQEALIVISASRRESQNPAQKAFDFVSKLNSRPFFGGEKGLWMCTVLGGDSDDGGETYMVNYEFVRRQGGWFTTAIFTDARTGEIPTDIVTSKQVKTAKIDAITQEFVDFKKLKLKLST